eukprot:TRINITY_DN1129_c0_g1_i1.p1 TRINITY_DN1129_c0_g1~~TRINITY_DN1129_c0_g1_i1.p1  ORF type:complete len:144 (+),score=34.86 TRINITY_DN1129_c0_g1_i1:52-483(+)
MFRFQPRAPLFTSQSRLPQTNLFEKQRSFKPLRFFADAHHETTEEEAPYYFTREEVARHNKTNNCWIIIHGKVYNVTKWIPKHPGLLNITRKAGHDSTDLFEGRGHSKYAREIMKEYYIGDLVPEERKGRRVGLNIPTDPDPH